MSTLFHRARAWLLCVALAGIAENIHATQITLTDALRRTLVHSPALAVFPTQQREADAQALQAGLRPAPTLALDIENLAGNGPMHGTDSAEYTLAISQAIELGDKRDKRVDVAHLQKQDVATQYDIARADALAQTASRFVECAREQAIVDWAQRRLQWAERSAKNAADRASAGAASNAETRRLEIAVIRARIALDRARVQHSIALNALAASWGGERADVDRVVADLTALPAIAPQQTWQQRLATAPQLQRYATRERLLAAQQQLAAAQATPDVTVNLGVRRLEADNANALVLGASMPLAFGARNRANVAIARAHYERNNVEQQRTTQEMRTQLYGLYQQLSITRSEAHMLRNEALPKAQQAYREFERGYNAGRFSTLELLSAQDEQLTLEREAIDAEASFHLQHIALQQLTGQVIGEVSP